MLAITRGIILRYGSERFRRVIGAHDKRAMIYVITPQDFPPRPPFQRIMSITKIPFILLSTWGYYASLTPPNPPPPENERITSQVPMETPKFTQWGSFGLRVRNF